MHSANMTPKYVLCYFSGKDNQYARMPLPKKASKITDAPYFHSTGCLPCLRSDLPPEHLETNISLQQ